MCVFMILIVVSVQGKLILDSTYPETTMPIPAMGGIPESSEADSLLSFIISFAIASSLEAMADLSDGVG